MDAQKTGQPEVPCMHPCIKKLMWEPAKQNADSEFMYLTIPWGKGMFCRKRLQKKKATASLGGGFHYI